VQSLDAIALPLPAVGGRKSLSPASRVRGAASGVTPALSPGGKASPCALKPAPAVLTGRSVAKPVVAAGPAGWGQPSPLELGLVLASCPWARVPVRLFHAGVGSMCPPAGKPPLSFRFPVRGGVVGGGVVCSSHLLTQSRPSLHHPGQCSELLFFVRKPPRHHAHPHPEGRGNPLHRDRRSCLPPNPRACQAPLGLAGLKRFPFFRPLPFSSRTAAAGSGSACRAIHPGPLTAAPPVLPALGYRVAFAVHFAA